jgi:thiol-disulfide isomerase/thioredoxin
MNRHPATRIPRGFLVAVLLTLPACGPAVSPPAADAPGDRLLGLWRAVLLSPGGDLPFGLEVFRRDGRLEAVAINGSERAPFSDVTVDGDDVTLAFDWYDSRIEARLDEDAMSGRWWKTVPGGISALDFVATRGAADRFTPLAAETPGGAFADVGGSWRVEFVDDAGTELVQGEFRQQDERVTGTFLSATGDYRFLDGSFAKGLLRLSAFDGGHAYLFHARAQEDGTLRGDYWSRDRYHARWTASRSAPGAEPILPDAWGLAGLTNAEGRFRFAFEDVDGKPLASDDPRFAGKVVLANLFGSWCPNCNDEAPLLAAWDRRYRRRGLELVGLAYEYSGDGERDRRYVRKYAARHGIAFPLLLAGISDKAAASATLPDLAAVIAFPTTVFVGRDGKVRRIYSGFSGPGTGAHYEALVAELEELIESLLAEPSPPAPAPV